MSAEWSDRTLCGLTPPQVHILERIAVGDRDEEIAALLTLTLADYRRELRVLCRRLGARSRLALVVKAFRGGWVS